MPDDIARLMPQYDYYCRYFIARDFLGRQPAEGNLYVIGFDDTLSRQLSPPLTSVAFPMDEIGDTTMKLLMERIKDKRKVSKSVTLSPIFVDRGSVKDIR